MAKPLVHLVNPFENTSGGSEWRTIELFRLLRDSCDVRLWSIRTPNPHFAELAPIQCIDAAQGQFPRDGCLVIVGAYYPLGDWIAEAKYARAILVYNVVQPARLATVRAQLQRAAPRVDVVFASHALMRESGVAGVVQVSPIDLVQFAPRERAIDEKHVFTVGRLSRETPRKHHPPDIELYRALAANGCRVRIMGGVLLGEALGHHHNIELLPVDSIPPEEFLRGLDCFYYRTNNSFFETFGRVVMEAMACGVPVVAHRRGGYAEEMQDGIDSFLIDNRREGFARIMALKNDAAFARSIGLAARNAMERIYSAEALEGIAAFYRDG